MAVACGVMMSRLCLLAKASLADCAFAVVFPLCEEAGAGEAR